MSTTNYFPLNADKSENADDPTAADKLENQCSNKDYIFNGSDNVDKTICDSINASSSSPNIGSSVEIEKQTIEGMSCEGECVTNPPEVPEGYNGDFNTSDYTFAYCGSDDDYVNHYYAKNPIDCDPCSYDDLATTICDADSDPTCTAAGEMTDYKLDIYAAAESYINFSKDIEIIKDEDTLNDNIIGINLRWNQSLTFTKCLNTIMEDYKDCVDITDPEIVHFYLTTKAINNIKIYAATIDTAKIGDIGTEDITFSDLNLVNICANGNPDNLTPILNTETNVLPSHITSTEELKNEIANKLGSNNNSPFYRFVLCEVTHQKSKFILPFIWQKKNVNNYKQIIYPGDVEDNAFPLSVFNINSSTKNLFTGNAFSSNEQGFYLNINYPLTKIYKPILTKDTNTNKEKYTIPIRAPFSENVRYRLKTVSEDDYVEDDNIEDDYIEETTNTTKYALVRYKDCCSQKGIEARCNYDGTCITEDTPAVTESELSNSDYGYGIKSYCTLDTATYQLKLNQFTLDYSNENCANFDICTFNSFK